MVVVGFSAKGGGAREVGIPGLFASRARSGGVPPLRLLGAGYLGLGISDFLRRFEKDLRGLTQIFQSLRVTGALLSLW